MDNHFRIELNELDKTQLVKQFMLKPKKTVYLFVIIAVAIMVAMRSVVGILIGAFFLLFPLINLLVIKNQIVLEIYPDYFVIPDAKEKTSGYKIVWDEVEEFSFENESWQAMVFVVKLKNNTSFAIPSSDYGIQQEFKKRIPEAEKFKRMQQRMNERNQKRHNK